MLPLLLLLLINTYDSPDYPGLTIPNASLLIS